MTALRRGTLAGVSVYTETSCPRGSESRLRRLFARSAHGSGRYDGAYRITARYPSRTGPDVIETTIGPNCDAEPWQADDGSSHLVRTCVQGR